MQVVKLAREMAAKLQTEEGRAACRKRKWIAEPPNGWIKNVLEFRQFSLRGLHRVRAEWKLVCMALNLRRMAVLSAGWTAAKHLSGWLEPAPQKEAGGCGRARWSPLTEGARGSRA